MIVKKVIKKDKIKSVYKSSNILASTYDKSDNSLTIIFKSGKEYKYENVSIQDYTRFEIAESQGQVFNKHIRPYYVGKFIGEVDINDINKIIEEEDKLIEKELEGNIVGVIEKIINSYNVNKQLYINDLEQVCKLIEDYINKKKYKNEK